MRADLALGIVLACGLISPRPALSQAAPPPPTTPGPPPQLRISMPAGEVGTCRYRLSAAGGAWSYTIAPGQKQDLPTDRQWRITFERGIDGASQSYLLRPGHYRFRRGLNGWELYRSASMEVEPSAPPPLAPAPLADD